MSTDHDRTGPTRAELDVRLAVIIDIARAMRDPQPPDCIIQAAVDSLHVHFPDLRSAYSTVARDGQITVDRSAGSARLAWPSSAGEPGFAGRVMETLGSRDLLAIEDTASDITSGAPSAGLVSVNIRALLHAPVRHSETLVGFLSLDSSTPRQWSGHERTTLRDAADFLAVGLRDADASRRLEDGGRKHPRSRWAARAQDAFRLVAESSPAIITLTQQESVVYLNPELARLSEYSYEELTRASPWDIIHPDDRDMTRSYRVLRERGQTAPIRYETRIVTKSGKTRWLDIRTSTFDLAGKQTLLTTGLDITARKLWEQGISESEARLRTLMEHLTDGVGLVVDGTIAFANPAMARLLGYTPDELVDHRPTEFFVPGDQQRATERIDAITDGAPGPPSEYQMVRRDGTTVPVLISSERIEYDGRPAVLSILRDLTEQRRLQEQVRQTQRLDSVGQLAGGVAHNFNNALAAIIGYSELIAMRLDADDPVLADVKQILAVAERSAALTRQLLTFSRKEQISPTAFDLNEVIESSSSLLGPLMGDHILLHLRLDRSLRRVWADRWQMEQVITNLVLNARDAMPDGGSLTIETSDVAVTEALARTYPDARCGTYARLSVIDTGAGIARATLARIFEPFFTTKEPGQGVGLGLSMVHGAVKQTGGFVTVDSAPGRGTTLALYLPVYEEPTSGSEVVVESSVPS